MNYFNSGQTHWEAASSSVIRGALSERKSTSFKPPKHLHQKIMVLTWGWMMFILISAYKANLLAMITRPSLDIPFTNAKDMVKQTQIKWGLVKDELFSTYAKSKASGTPLRKIYDHRTTTFKSSYCQSMVKESGNTALICDISEAMYIMANDFSKTGTCNFFLTEDKILATDSALAFQVTKVIF